MGAFFLVRKEPAAEPIEPADAYRRPLAVFAEKELRLNREIHAEDFDLYVFHKQGFDVENIVDCEGDDFICVTGTLIYKHRTGPDSLRALHRDFDPETGVPAHDLSGNFCAILRKGGVFHLFNDYTGLYQVFTDTDRRIFSSSFLAVVRSLDTKTPATQELYEYLLTGATYGDRTIFEEVDLIDSRRFLTLGASHEDRRKPFEPHRLAPGAGFADALDQVVERLTGFFEDVRDGFESVCSGLSGGYDSRLMLGFMRKVGIDPYLYVYGSNASPDVRAAKRMAEGEGFALHHRDRTVSDQFTPDAYHELLRRQFYARDGLYNYGIFDDGQDLATRIERASYAQLQLNGGNGRIYRDTWFLPDRWLSASALIRSRYEREDYSVLTPVFDKAEFFDVMTRKVRESVEVDRDEMTRLEADLVFSLFQTKYWMGINNSHNSQFGHTLTPYADQSVIWQAGDVPMKMRRLGKFQNALVDTVDHRLAGYPSTYGHNFINPVPLGARMKGWVRVGFPLSLRPFVLRNWGTRTRKDAGKLPAYLTPEFRARLELSDDLAVARYVDFDRLGTKRGILSRALSVEVLLRDLY